MSSENIADLISRINKINRFIKLSKVTQFIVGADRTKAYQMSKRRSNYMHFINE